MPLSDMRAPPRINRQTGRMNRVSWPLLTCWRLPRHF